ncbi:MAG TPA: S8 family peptidase, partial [Candidatus Sulfotelmatobacter sp.]|nr:S8 family peptidase [Candidatus Sulfotelmatobacter sp.]
MPTASGTNETGFHPQRVLVKPRQQAFANPAAVRAGMANLHAALGARSLRTFPQIGDLEVVAIPPARSVDELVQQYRSSPLVEYAELDYEFKAFAVPNDPGFPQLWGLQNSGTNGGVVGADIHAPGGWDIRSAAGNVIVAITDTGIRLTHEDLAANLWTNPGEVPGNGRDDDGDGFIDDVHGINVLTGAGDPTDDAGHGTHVAGIIGAMGNNAKGVAGVAWQVQLMALKWLDSTGRGYTSDAIQCLDYARAKGASIVNASWGGPYYSRALYDAIASLRTSGIIFVTAAGNDGMDNGQYFPYPASYPLDNIVSVAASDRTDQLAFFSDYGGVTVGLAAPGQEILSTWYTGDSDYAVLSGTSMAAPHVCGALALLQAQLPTENYLARIYRLYATADPLPGLAGKCLAGGRLNLQRALESTLQT